MTCGPKITDGPQWLVLLNLVYLDFDDNGRQRFLGYKAGAC